MSKYLVHLEALTIGGSMLDNLRYLITPSTHSIYNSEERADAQTFVEQNAIELFDSAQDANDRKITRSKDNGQRYTVTFVADYDALSAWTDRENERMRTDYIAVPWKIAPIYRLHFAHMSVKLAGQIAYTKSEEHGIADRQTRIKPGRYLQQFYAKSNESIANQLRAIGVNPDRFLLDDRQIADYAEQCTAANLELKMTKDANEIRSIYMNGPRSCMTREASRYAGHDHPSIVYAGPHSSLSLAYHGPIDHPTSRALVNPEKKTVVRVYPNNECALAKLLRANGYKIAESSNDYSAIIGETIAAIEDANGYGYLMPYIDGADYAYLTKDKTRFVLGTDRHADVDRDRRVSVMCQLTQSSNGETIALGVTDPDVENRHRHDDDDEDRFTCENCSDDYHEDYRSIHDSSLCESCADSIFRCCPICDEYIDTRDDDMHRVTLYRNGRNRTDRICSSCYENDSRSCESCGSIWFDRYDNDAYHGRNDDLCESCAQDEENDDPIESIEDGTNITIGHDDSIVAYGSIHCIANVFRVMRVDWNDDRSPSYIQCTDPILTTDADAPIMAADPDLTPILAVYEWFTTHYPRCVYVITFGSAFVRATSDRFVVVNAAAAAAQTIAQNAEVR